MRLTVLVIFVGLAAVSGASFAETLPAQEDFTFRRIKPPVQGQKRITVQIDPAEQARRLASYPDVKERAEKTVLDPVTKPDGSTSMPVAPSAPVANASYGWFWDKVPTTIAARDGRFPIALATLSQGPGGSAVSAPRLQTMQEIATKYGTNILAATIGTEVSPALVLAVMGIESGGRVDAVSSAGAQGLMQLIPDTAKRFGVSDSMDAAQNIKGGVDYLDWLMKTFDRDPLMVLAAYNAGEGAVQANAGVPPYAETRDYVPKVLAAWQVAQGLCMTPPELVTDPCVFRILSASN
ncbi:MAG: lytic murein transglycosylase [Cereibacter sphaeroides]|uniref:Lytic murein transglycosylase n=1 Tax=Cereibacter sphaeroides TaxID=1063 RepID=A0A2W5UAX0_CERSP|nr:MAG: lytic murein transglycosylase [Cereibacter sphaeroides]